MEEAYKEGKLKAIGVKNVFQSRKTYIDFEKRISHFKNVCVTL